MSIKGNKGEWSELYAFLKILSDQVLFSADENLVLIPNAFIKILEVLREKKSLIYSIDREHNQILIKKNSNILTKVPIINISSKLSNILKKIQMGSNSKGAFPIEEAETIMQELHANKLKSGSTEKADIFLKFEDPTTGTHPTKGFSIKSQLGGMSSLLNASTATNFEFKIVATANQTEKPRYKPRIRLGEKLSDDEKLEFVSIPNTTFFNNLKMIDSLMPQMLAEIVKGYYLGHGKDIKELTEYIKKSNPLNVEHPEYFISYEYKVQQLLRAVAFGMQPTKLWAGYYETHGGYIIVRSDGELACYHMYDRNKFSKFLYLNTKLETPSTTRHKFGEIYEINNEKYIKLNLQIRFK